MNDINSRIIHYLDNQSSILKVSIAPDGTIIKANAFAEELAGKPLQSSQISDLFTGFNANLDMTKFLVEELDHVMLNVNTKQNLPETYYFTSFKVNEEMILIGEQDSKEIKDLRQTMYGLNNEMSNMTRDLQKKNVQLEKLNNLKNQFLGMAAHDLRNPISSNILFCELVLDSDDFKISAELRQLLSMIKNSSEFMLHLIEELLDVTKIESNKLHLNIEMTQIEDLLRKNISINALLAAKKNIELVLNIPQPLPITGIDPTKIEQVLNNLISNAIKYSHKHTTVTISAIVSDRQLQISVQDQGLGIPKNELVKVFTPFPNISIRGTAGEKSTGLGLSIVQSIVKGHNGKIWVESEVGIGSVFCFTLPLNNQINNKKP